jgi:Flp pilus assembly protein TadD
LTGCCFAAGCAVHRSDTLAARLVRPGKPSISYDVPGQNTETFSQATFSDLRRQALEARGDAKPAALPTIETTDSLLAAALKRAEAEPSADNWHAVAVAYRRVGILDKAFDYLTLTLKKQPASVSALIERAEIWKRWNFPGRGFADAYRAVYIAPKSAPAHNALGTLLQATGSREGARLEYQRALALDPHAAYARNNLCYLSFTEGRFDEAIGECERALEIAPEFTVARNNLALAYASRGDLDKAQREFRRAGPSAASAFNVGLIYEAAGQYLYAEEAFREASNFDSSLSSKALKRALQAAAIAQHQRHEHNHSH